MASSDFTETNEKPVSLYAQLSLLGIVRNLKNIKVWVKDLINVFLALVILKIMRES